MKNRIWLSLIILPLLIFNCLSLRAQNTDAFAYGILTTRSELKISDMAQLSRYNQGFGTARSAAMGGAFTSLGADLSTLTINPAGLGMYRSNDISITPAILISNSDGKNASGDMVSSSRSRFGINNFSAAFNLYESSFGALTSFTMAIGYNKVADFNYTTGVDIGTSYPNNPSLADVFRFQLTGYSPRDLDAGSAWDNLGMNRWGAIMAYRSGLVEHYTENGQNLYDIYAIGYDADIYQRLRIKTIGSIGEYTISGGFNIRNTLYLGFSLSIQDIYMKQYTYYDETYTRNQSAANPLDFVLYDQFVRTSGTAVNFKFGAIFRPIDPLRIGIAVHTPSFVSVDKDYSADLELYYNNNREGFAQLDNYFADNFNTPTRLLTGISYTFGNVAVLSADYELTWYNGIRLTGEDVHATTKNWYKGEIKDNFKAASTFRIGAEVKPIPEIALRAGYAFYGNMLKDENRVYDDMIEYKSQNISAGIGYRFDNGCTLDFAYIYMKSDFTKYDLFSYNGYNTDIYSGDISTERQRHNVMMTFGWRF